MTFGRIRVNITSLPYSGTYTIYHPFGTWVFPNQVAGDRIFFTQDVGIACPGTFGCTLGTDIGPFLLPSPVAGGAEVPPIPDLLPGQDPWYDAVATKTAYPATGKKYLSDPARIGPVSGSPLAPFVGSDGLQHNHNTFRVEGPNSFVMDGETNFSVNGRVMTGTLPGKVTVDRASYAEPVASASGNKVDVFATAFPTTQGRIPTQPTPAATTPILTFFDAACGVDPTTGALTAPPTPAPPAVLTETQMVSADASYWGQAHPATVPAAVCVEDATARNAAGQVVPAYYQKTVTDEIAITTASSANGATYDPALNGGTLTVTANSSDKVVPAALTLAGFNKPLVNGSIAIAPLAAPPAKVTVVSAQGGSAELMVTTAVGTAGGGGITPLAANDDLTMSEDCSATPASSCATPLLISPLANDTYSGGPIPAGAVVTITQQPRIGTMGPINPDGSFLYTPNPNANGTEGIGYTVTVNGLVSNQAYITIHITPVNDAPLAVNDTAGAVVGKVNSVNVLANDIDPDGATDLTTGLAKAVIVTWPAGLGAKPTPTNGIVTFTPTSTGSLTFTYRAMDAAGALSANTASVTVTVAGSEAIIIAKAIYKQGNQGGGASARWTVSGTDSVREGQTLTVVYNNGTLTAAQGGGSCNGTTTNPKCVIGTTVVDALGNYVLDFVTTPGGPLDPTDTTAWATKPNQVKVFSTAPALGGSQTASIQLK
jgi:Big-like domain-containing protein